MSTGLVSLFIAAWLIVSIASPALAYLDPVTGSFLIQGAIASAVAVLAALRSVRERVAALLGFRKEEPAPLDSPLHSDSAKKAAASEAPKA